MKNSERLLGFLSAMLITFGLTDLNFEQPAFDDNQKAYATLGLGLFMFLIFVVRIRKSKL
ncbi:MAG: hypothetical protein RIC95_12695 [Vicingaceae bacterium]